MYLYHLFRCSWLVLLLGFTEVFSITYPIYYLFPPSRQKCCKGGGGGQARKGPHNFLQMPYLLFHVSGLDQISSE